MRKRIFIDIETVGTNQFKADILESTFLFVEDNGTEEFISEFTSKIKYNKKYKDLDEYEINALKWHGIISQKDIDKHNKKAIKFKKYIKKVLKYASEFGRYPLSGWNNASFDNVILNRHLLKLDIYIGKYFDYHTRDICNRMNLFQEKGIVKGSTLMAIHSDLIGTIKHEDFHNSSVDCLATLGLDDWINCNLYKLCEG